MQLSNLYDNPEIFKDSKLEKYIDLKNKHVEVEEMA